MWPGSRWTLRPQGEGAGLLLGVGVELRSPEGATNEEKGQESVLPQKNRN